jgi:hypothetical protein
MVDQPLAGSGERHAVQCAAHHLVPPDYRLVAYRLGATSKRFQCLPLERARTPSSERYSLIAARYVILIAGRLKHRT